MDLDQIYHNDGNLRWNSLGEIDVNFLESGGLTCHYFGGSCSAMDIIFC
jgi:hypothetical protein